LNLEQFEALVDESIAQVPEDFRKRIDNLAVVVEDFPDRWTMQRAGIANPYQLLGFYHGIPLTQRTQSYANVAPDQISIYRQPIMAQARSEQELRELVGHVVRHELAHYFGIDDDRLMEIGAY
jgi:predicted Zn-dependent protease with MMP-like domain